MLERFSSPAATLISLHSHKTNRKKGSDSRSRAVHKQRLQASSVSSAEQKISDGGTSRDRLLAGRSGNPAPCEVKGRGHLVCALQRADGSVLLSNVSQDRLAILRRELGAYILAVRLFMYLPWFLTGFHHIPKTSHISPKSRWNKAK